MKILVVDDEEDIKLLFSYKFKNEITDQKLAFTFKFSSNEALNFLNSVNDADLYLILTDINMPGMNGFEFLQIIKKKYPHLKVFMITAYGDTGNYHKALEFGADDFITKPIDFNQLKNKIYALMNHQA